MPLYIAKSGDLDRCHRCLTDSQRKDSATQLLIKYKSGALVTQYADQRDQDYMTVLCVVNVLVFNFVELGCDIYQNFDHQSAKGILSDLPSKICRITGSLKSDI